MKTGSAVCGVLFYGRLNFQATLLALMLAILLMSSAMSAHAALGGNATSITQDHAALGGTLTTAQRAAVASVNAVGVNVGNSATSAAQYAVTTIKTDLGTTVNEYATTAGVVFAISWSGPAVPNLGQLLGTHAADMRSGAAANAAAGNAHGPMTMDNGDLVVFSGGMMQAYHGLAYLKSALPSGFSPTNLR